jgi:hypothetical protein
MLRVTRADMAVAEIAPSLGGKKPIAERYLSHTASTDLAEVG